MAITLKDVASVAGVSTATVSRALAGSERVSPQTADHIRTIANDLGYRYDNVARALRQKRSNLVGLVLPDFDFPYSKELLFALNRELFQSEFVLAAVASFGSVDQELIQVERLLGQRIDALLIVPADPFHSLDNSAKAIDIALEEDLPVFQLFERATHAATVDILLDYLAGIELALRSLSPGGIQSIACIDDADVFAARSKLNACQQLQSRFPGQLSFVPLIRNGSTRRASYQDAMAKLHATPLPDLIICGDEEALRVVVKTMEATAAGETGPLVLCLDPVDPALTCANASILSIEFPMGAMAREIAERINAALNGGLFQRETLRVQPFVNLSLK